jgi:hypothetical protein
MDLATLIIGLLSVAVFIVPVLYIQRKQKGNSGKLLAAFMAAGAQQGLRITKHERWNEQFAIGLDETQHKLFYMNKQALTPQQVVVDLAEVKNCAVVNMSRDVNGSRIIDLIGLRFSFHNTKWPEQLLEFYNKEESMLLSGELQLAEKWRVIVSDAMAQGGAANSSYRKQVEKV